MAAADCRLDLRPPGRHTWNETRNCPGGFRRCRTGEKARGDIALYQRKIGMSFYYIGNPDPENPYRWAYNTGVASTAAIIKALRQAGYRVRTVQSTESVTPYLTELEISKRGGTREQIEEICAAVDPAPKATPPSLAGDNPRFSRR
jgi:hypothetical protein